MKTLEGLCFSVKIEKIYPPAISFEKFCFYQIDRGVFKIFEVNDFNRCSDEVFQNNMSIEEIESIIKKIFDIGKYHHNIALSLIWE